MEEGEGRPRITQVPLGSKYLHDRQDQIFFRRICSRVIHQSRLLAILGAAISHLSPIVARAQNGLISSLRYRKGKCFSHKAPNGG